MRSLETDRLGDRLCNRMIHGSCNTLRAVDGRRDTNLIMLVAIGAPHHDNLRRATSVVTHSVSSPTRRNFSSMQRSLCFYFLFNIQNGDLESVEMIVA